MYAVIPNVSMRMNPTPYYILFLSNLYRSMFQELAGW